VGFTVTLITEFGDVLEEIDEPGGLFDLLPDHSDESSQCLRFVDAYGDTVFNTLPIPTFLRELAQVEARTSNETMHRFIADLRRMAEQCQNHSHLYLKFIGD